MGDAIDIHALSTNIQTKKSRDHRRIIIEQIRFDVNVRICAVKVCLTEMSQRIPFYGQIHGVAWVLALHCRRWLPWVINTCAVHVLCDNKDYVSFWAQCADYTQWPQTLTFWLGK